MSQCPFPGCENKIEIGFACPKHNETVLKAVTSKKELEGRLTMTFTKGDGVVNPTFVAITLALALQGAFDQGD